MNLFKRYLLFIIFKIKMNHKVINFHKDNENKET